ncbi:ribonucleotide reductase-subunit 2-like protein [Bufonid herpesvirus 1]|uniref:ribonucleotide reductase-subunit 2-like protein n=1 Tax=Bufonid herpesvirus 1 TaxID=2282206 RepID=UPI000EB63D24|nr:ribonucleotide reductase-subunit 2-like protein [Bufonid herpesvirus 1]AXF48523.1 ribonucleotide reductase-subunit 2-like protein [Bufonid herpesvirus 1]
MDGLVKCGDQRFSLHNMKHPDLWQMYKKAQASVWVAEEIDLSQDLSHWHSLKEEESSFILQVLAFFATSDGIVTENLITRFYSMIEAPEARAFYAFQAYIETVHAETYTLLLDTFIKDEAEKDRLFSAVTEVPHIRAKANWTLSWIENDDQPLAIKLAAFAAVEGIFFSSSFAAIFWLKKRGIMPGLTFSNELISRDEGLHTDFACMLFKKIALPTDRQLVSKVICEASELEKEFARSVLPVNLLGINSETMCQYVEFVTDRLLKELGLEQFYGSQNPFDFMEFISLEGKTNFFEKRVSEYQKMGVAVKSDRVFVTDADF